MAVSFRGRPSDNPAESHQVGMLRASFAGESLVVVRRLPFLALALRVEAFRMASLAVGERRKASAFLGDAFRNLGSEPWRHVALPAAAVVLAMPQ